MQSNNISLGISEAQWQPCGIHLSEFTCSSFDPPLLESSNSPLLEAELASVTSRSSKVQMWRKKPAKHSKAG